MTLNQLLVVFRDIATRHKQVHSFKIAQDFNIDAEEALTFPCLVVNPITSELPKTENGYTMYSIKFDVQLLDLMNKDRDNEDDVISDNLTILREIVNEFNTHPYYMDSGIDLIGTISFRTIRGAYDSDVTGWRCEMEMQSPNRLSFCGSPISNLTGYDFSAASVTVNDGADTYELYPSDTYTCSSGVTPAGIAYQRPLPTGQNISYEVYDDAWQLANNPYSAPPTNPLYTQELDLDTDDTGKTLLYDSEFGNKFRFTDVNGIEEDSTSEIYIIDNLTGLGWYKNATSLGVKSFNNALGIGGTLEIRNNALLLGFSDWKLANSNEARSIFTANYNSGSDSGILISAIIRSQYITSTTFANNSTTNCFRVSYGPILSSIGKSTAIYNLYCRNHF